LATIGYIVNIKLIPYRFRVDLSPGEAQYAAAVTDPALSVRPVVIFKRNTTCGRNLLLSIYVSVWK
jgi:hypothetical protein